MITIIDYRAGNLASVRKAFAHVGAVTSVTEDPQQVRSAEILVLPGVGHFATMQRLETTGLKAAITDAIRRGVPFLGICLGMQWLFEGSEEAPQVAGLGQFAGTCTRFPAGIKSPHVGWNTITRLRKSALLEGVPDAAFVYYTHSYRAPVTYGVVGTTDYGAPFAAAVERDNVFGVQFHPEKSGDSGLKIVQNFCAIALARQSPARTA